MPSGPTATLEAMIKADPGCTLAAATHDFYVAKNIKSWKDRRTLCGNGQCAILVQTATGCGKTRFWVRGPVVKGNAAVPEGTAIAIFSDDGTYPHLGKHAAIYLSQDAAGLNTLDQWAHDESKKAVIEKNGYFFKQKFDNKTYPLNDGNRFHVILTVKKIVNNEEADGG